MLTEPPAAPTAEIMIAMMAMPVTAPAIPAAAAAVAVRRGLRRRLHSPRPMAGSAAMTSSGARIGMTKEQRALNKPRSGTMAPSSRAITAVARRRAARTSPNHKNRALPGIRFAGMNDSKGCVLDVSVVSCAHGGATGQEISRSPTLLSTPSRASADQQHELPAHVTVLADAVRLRDLGEREGLRDREREAPGVDQLADLGERVDRAAGVPAAEPHPVLLRATEVGDRHDVLRAARELDELGQDAASGDVERRVDAVGRERANPLDEALAVGDGLGPQRAKVLVVCRTGGADHACAAYHGELDGGAADASGGAVDEQRAAAPDAELVKRARGRLDGGRQRGSASEVERRRDRRIVGQHRQVGLGRPPGGEAEHAILDSHVRNTLAELVDDARRLVAHGLRELPAHQPLALLPVAR